MIKGFGIEHSTKLVVFGGWNVIDLDNDRKPVARFASAEGASLKARELNGQRKALVSGNADTWDAIWAVSN